MVSPGTEKGWRVAEGRVGLSFSIGEFVVAEDQSPRARLARLRRRLAWRWKRAQVHLRATRRGLEQRMAALGLANLVPAAEPAIVLFRRGVLACRDATVLLALILRYAWSRPVSTGEPDGHNSARRSKSALILGLAMLALAFALFLPERERDMLPAEPIIASAEASTPEVAAADLRRQPEPALPAEHRPWQPVRQPMALYNLESPDMAGLSLQYRVSQRDRSRQDTLIWQARSDAPEIETRRSAALLVVERHEGSAPTEKPLFADIAARAAEHLFVVERMARPQDIRTKFGAMEAAEVMLRQEKGAVPCLAFRRIDMAGVTLVGWICGNARRPVDRVSAACFLDRLDLIGGGRDVTLRKFFAEAERSRQNCASARQSGRRLTWIDHEAPVPALKLTARR